MGAPLRQLASFALWGALAGLAIWIAFGDSAPDPGLANIILDRGGGDDRPGSRSGPAGGATVPLGAPRDSRPPRAPRVPATPPRLEIPAIHVRAHVTLLGRTASGELDVPENWSVVGRWSGGSKPGEPGPAVLVGHVQSQTRAAVFHRLRELQPGDTVRYTPREGPVRRFAVVHKQRTAKANFPTEAVYGETREPTLRLVTCGGTFDRTTGHYRDNVIVYARRI